MTSLSTIKVGDFFIHMCAIGPKLGRGGGYLLKAKKIKATKVTRCYIFSNNYKFRKSDGAQIDKNEFLGEYARSLEDN